MSKATGLAQNRKNRYSCRMWREDAKFWILISSLLILVGIGVYVEKNPTLRMRNPTDPTAPAAYPPK